MVWEECIILMPKQARFVFLSATIPNAREFADWIAKIHGCHLPSSCHDLQHLRMFGSPGDTADLSTTAFNSETMMTKAVCLFPQAAECGCDESA